MEAVVAFLSGLGLVPFVLGGACSGLISRDLAPSCFVQCFREARILAVSPVSLSFSGRNSKKIVS